MESGDLYQILGAGEKDDFAALKRAYYRKARLCHPDHHGNSAAMTAEFRLVIEAFNVLSDPEKRRRYDASRSSRKTGPSSGKNSRKRSAFDHGDSILDTEADDILEELIVGNDPPAGTTLMTLFEDLEKTRVFITWREARYLWGCGHYREALPLFKRLAGLAPGNILYRVFLARTHASLGNFSNSLHHYRAAIEIGLHREPPQILTGVRKELERTEKQSHPLLHTIRKWFEPEAPLPVGDAADEMCRSANRVLDRMYRESSEEEDDPEERKQLQ